MCKTSQVVTTASSKTEKKEKKNDVKKEVICKKSKTIKKPKDEKKIKKKRNLSIMRAIKQAEEETNDHRREDICHEKKKKDSNNKDIGKKKIPPKKKSSEPKFNPFCHVDALFKTEYKPTIEETPFIYRDGDSRTVAPEIAYLLESQELIEEEEEPEESPGDFLRSEYCSRCMRYGCVMHTEYPQKMNGMKAVRKTKRSQNYHCGDKCYKHILKAEKKGKVEHTTKGRRLSCEHRRMLKTMVENDRMKKPKSKSGYGYNGTIKNDKIPQPCDHKGPCTAAKGCWCVKNRALCSKYCACPPTCLYKFPGCKCEPGQCRTEKCMCVLLKWECDPDVCKSCNPLGEITRMQYEGPNPNLREDIGQEFCYDENNEIKKNMEKSKMPICCNYNLQRGISKNLTIGVSTVAGFGCFAGEDIKAGEYIAEYTGEVVDEGEAERRGAVYDSLRCSYLFTLNKTQIVDATIYGNFTRFINHSARDPNVGPKILTADNEQRIAFFANHDIKKGEELFFDYQYGAAQADLYVPLEIEEINGKKVATTVIRTKKPASRKRKR